MDIKEATEIAGTLSNTSKMPGFSYGIPALYCKKGSELRKDPESPCYTCYALKGFYVMGSVKRAQLKRFDSLHHPLWIEAMVTLINHYTKKTVPFFRWHDAGDIESVKHLQNIYEICQRLPDIKFWLPTQEYEMVLEAGPPPDNLTIRVSNSKVGIHKEHNDFPTSGVTAASPAQWVEAYNNVTKRFYPCPSSLNDGKCGTCRACWNKNVEHIVYRKH